MKNRQIINLKRIIVLLLCVAIILPFGGCKKDGEYDINEAGYNTYIAYDKLFLSAEAAYLNDDGYVESDDIPAILDEVEQLAQQGVSEGTIAHYNREDDNIFIKFTSGIPYLFIPYEEGILSGGGEAKILTLEPNENDYSVNLSYIVAMATAWGCGITYEDSLRPSSNANLVVENIPDLYSYDYRFELPYDVIDPILGAGDSLRNSNVTIESMKKLADYKIIIWEGHGGHNDEIHSALITGESFVGWKEFSKYKSDLEDDIIVLTSFPTIGETEIAYSPVRYYGITSKFVEKYIGEMDDSLVFLGACSSLEDDILAQSFLDKGAGVVLGYTDETTMYYEMISRTVFFTELVKKDASGYQTVANAYQSTMNIVGNDNNSKLSYKSQDGMDSRYTLSGILNESPVNEIPATELVTDAYSKDCTYTAKVYNYETDKSEETEITCTFRIPRVNLSGNNIKTINTEIYDALYPVIENSAEEIREYGYPLSSEEISYRWAVNGNILSLVILNSSAPDQGGGDVYMVYNIDISSGENVPTDSIIQAAGFSEEEYCEKAKQVLGSRFWSNWDPSDENFANQSFVDFFNEQLEKTISDDNIAQSYPYMNEKGQLCIIAKKYSLAAADYYWHDLNLIDFELSPYYESEADKITHAINISEDEAYTLACAYWDYSPGCVDKETGYELFLVYDGISEKNDGNHYYAFRLRWWVPEEAGWGNHMSTIDYLYINAESGVCVPQI